MAARARAEAPRRGAARAFRLGPIMVFWPRGSRESVLVRSDSYEGREALHAYDRAKDARLKGTTDAAIDSSEDSTEDSGDDPNYADLDGAEMTDEEVFSDFSDGGPSDADADLHADGAP